jgi:hypothetical protein
MSLRGLPPSSADFKMTSPDGIERINQLWLVTYINEAGQEIVARAKLGTGEYAPLIAADVARLGSMMPAARGLAKANNLKMRLIKFTNRLDIEDISRRATQWFRHRRSTVPVVVRGNTL